MRYTGKLFRPPSEAFSLIVQVTLGCTHNKCTFCCMYDDKSFIVRPFQDVVADFYLARKANPNVEKIFLADGDALAAPTHYLHQLLKEIRQLFPECKRVSAYASARNILSKNYEELEQLQSSGLNLLYLGLESGSDLILERINKGITSQEVIQACKQVSDAGIKTSITVISGLGGKELWQEHALATGKVLSAIDPNYVGLLTLMVADGTKIAREIEKGELVLLDPIEIAEETKLLLENLDVTNCVFRSNHASNYLILKGDLPQDKKRLINQIEQAIAMGNGFKSEHMRGL